MASNNVSQPIIGLGIFSTVWLTPLLLGRIRGFDAWQIATALVTELLNSTVDRYTQAWGDPLHAQAAALKNLWLLVAPPPAPSADAH